MSQPGDLLPGYLLVVGHTLDRDKMGRYSAALPPIYKDHAGFYLGIGGPGRGVDLLTGTWTGHSAVLAQFPSKSAIGAFWRSPAYTQAKALRRDGGSFQVFATQGLTLPPGTCGAFLVTVAQARDGSAYARAAAQEAEAATGAGLTPLVRAAAAEIERLEGEGAFEVSVIAAPTPAAAQAFRNDAAHADLRAALSDVADINVFLMAALPRAV